MNKMKQTWRIVDFLRDHRIDFALPGQSGKVSAGWVGICCPFCNESNYKLGYNIESNQWTCWSCGGKRRLDVLKQLCGCSHDRAVEVYRKYWNDTGLQRPRGRANQIAVPQIDTVSFPYFVKPMAEPHKAFLRSRNFDPEKIEREWLVKGTGPMPTNPQQLRVMIPVYFGGCMVCYQGRDITDKAKAKYWSLPRELSARPIKSCLYGYDRARKFSTVVVCEGPTDVWRLGPGAVALFGVAYRVAQVRLLAQWKRVVLLFDGDEAGYEAADKIRAELEIVGVDCAVMPTFGSGIDPADLSDEDAARFMREEQRAYA